MSVPPLRLGDRYVVGDVIGRGGMADVHRAHDTVLDRSVAVKVLRDVNTVDARRFADESRLLASLDHPQMVRLLDAGVEDERPWIALELVEGSTLRELMKAGPLDPDTAARIGRDVSSALSLLSLPSPSSGGWGSLPRRLRTPPRRRRSRSGRARRQ